MCEKCNFFAYNELKSILFIKRFTFWYELKAVGLIAFYSNVSFLLIYRSIQRDSEKCESFSIDSKEIWVLFVTIKMYW